MPHAIINFKERVCNPIRPNFAILPANFLEVRESPAKLHIPYTPIRLCGHKYEFCISGQNKPKQAIFTENAAIFRFSQRKKNGNFEMSAIWL